MRKSILIKSCWLVALLFLTNNTFAQNAPQFTMGATAAFAICENSNSISFNNYLSAEDWDNSEILTWTIVSPPLHGAATGSGASLPTNGSTVTPTGFTYTPDNGYDGSDAISVEVTDGMFTTMISLTIVVKPLPSVNAGVDQAVCLGQSVTLSGSGANSYIWDNGVSNGVAFTPSSTATFTVIGTGSNGCQNTDAVTVTVNPLPIVSAISDYALCSGQSTTLSGMGNADTYTWDNSVTNGVSFTPASTATYTVTGTITATGCQNSDQVVITINPLPAVTAPSDYAVCNGQGTILSASGNADYYSWDHAVINGSFFTPSTTATYTVTAGFNATGCENTDQVVITVNPLPNVNAGLDQSVCYNASVTLAGSGASTYVWNNSITNNVAFNALATTTYTVTGTDGNGCINTDQVLVTVNALQPDPFTVSTSTVYTGQNGVVYTVPNDPLVDYYTWSFTGVGAGWSGSNTNTETFNFLPSASTGSYNVNVIAHTNVPACSSPVRTMTVNVSDLMPWTGAVDNDWNTAGNWAGNFVPYSTIGALIPPTANDPMVGAVSADTVRDLVVTTGGNLDIDAGGELVVKRDLYVDGTVTGDYIVLGGSANQEIEGDGTVANLALNNAAGATITGGTFKISETYLPTNGTLTTNGNLTLTSDSNGTASILAPGALCSANYIDGEVTVQKYFPGGRRAFRFIAHPFNEWKPISILTDDIDITGNGGATNGFTTTGTNNPSSFFFDTWIASNDATNDVTGWIPFHTTTGFGTNSWDRGEGMRILIRGDKGEGLVENQAYTPSPATIDMPGNLNQCDVTYKLLDNGNIGVTGYNLKGNPYACNIDLVQAQRGDSVGNCFSVWDPWQGPRGAYVTGSFALMPSYILPAYSSFFVTSNGDTNGVDNIITFTESMKTTSQADDTLFKTTASTIGSDAVQLRILTDNATQSWDRLLIYFRNQASSQYDALDGRKFVNPVVNFFTISDTNHLALDARPMVTNSTIPLGFTTTENMQYSIRVDDYDISGTQLYLIDKFLNQSTPLAQGTQYDFTVNSNPLSQGLNRFEIGIGTATGVDQVKNANNINLSIAPNPADELVTISFNALKSGKTQVTIKNVLGQQVYSQDMGTMQYGSIKVPVKELAAGTYMVTVSCGDQVITQRLIKK